MKPRNTSTYLCPSPETNRTLPGHAIRNFTTLDHSCTSIPKISGHLKTANTRTVTRSMGYSEFRQISGTTLQNLVVRAAARDLCDLCIRFPLPLHSSAHREVIIWNFTTIKSTIFIHKITVMYICILTTGKSGLDSRRKHSLDLFSLHNVTTDEAHFCIRQSRVEEVALWRL